VWILNSGASEHTNLEPTFLHDLSQLKCPMMINLPNGIQVKVTPKEKLRITDGLILNDVLLVQSSNSICSQLKGYVNNYIAQSSL